MLPIIHICFSSSGSLEGNDKYIYMLGIFFTVRSLYRDNKAYDTDDYRTTYYEGINYILYISEYILYNKLESYMGTCVILS